MQKCAVCEKSVYGHPRPIKGPLVCGSCTLSKVKGTPAGKSMFAVRLGLSKVLGLETPNLKGTTMSSLKVKSNFARDRVILLDGKYSLKFNQFGEASCPSYYREALERLMASKPNRFWIVEDEVSKAPAPEELPAFAEEWAKKVEEETKKAEVPKQLDLSYLTEEVEEPAPSKKRGSKKKKSKD